MWPRPAGAHGNACVAGGNRVFSTKIALTDGMISVFVPAQAYLERLRAMPVIDHCFNHGVMLRYTGDILALGPSATTREDELGIMVDDLRRTSRPADLIFHSLVDYALRR